MAPQMFIVVVQCLYQKIITMDQHCSDLEGIGFATDLIVCDGPQKKSGKVVVNQETV